MCIRGGSWFSQKKSYAEARRDPERHFESETVKHCRTHFRDSTRRLRDAAGRVAWTVVAYALSSHVKTRRVPAIHGTSAAFCPHPPRAYVQLQGSLQQTAGTAAQAGVWSRLESPREERSVRSIDCLPPRPASSGSAEAEQGHEVAGLGLGLGRRRKRPRPRLSCSVHGKREEREQHCGG